jgi:hypothetical protein
VLNLNVDSFMIEFTEGRIAPVGAPDKSAEAKLFDVESVTARAFGDSQIKLVASDAEGNEVQVALDPEQARSVRADVEALEADSPVYE